MKDANIAALRDAIDATDDAIIALLKKRTGFVRQVGAIKQTSQPGGISYLRPGREALMVRRIWNAFQDAGDFPPQAAAQLWRLIISASLALESPFSVACAEAASMRAAQDYFGAFTPLALCAGVRAAFGALEEGSASVAVMPCALQEAWLPLPNGVRIFGCLPFLLPRGALPAALLAARLEPEATGEDVSMFHLSSPAPPSMSAYLEAHSLRLAAPLQGRIMTLQGFLTGEAPFFAGLQADLALAATWLGSYAVPIFFD